MRRKYPAPDPDTTVLRVLLALIDKVDHIHQDLVVLRAVAGRERPECYPRLPAATPAAEPRGDLP
jgi:hypothetical protein